MIRGKYDLTIDDGRLQYLSDATELLSNIDSSMNVKSTERKLRRRRHLIGSRSE
jgi:hypothetical protein